MTSSWFFLSTLNRFCLHQNRLDRLCSPPSLIFSVCVGVLRDSNNRQGVKYDLAPPYPETVDATESYLFFSWAKKYMVLKPSKSDIHFYVSSCHGQRKIYLSHSYQWRITANEGAVRVSRNNEARSYNHCCNVKAIRITYTEYVFVSLVTQQAQRMRLIILSSVRQAVSYFGTVCHKQHDVRKKRC